MSQIIELYKSNTNFIYVYAIEFLSKNIIGLYIDISQIKVNLININLNVF